MCRAIVAVFVFTVLSSELEPHANYTELYTRTNSDDDNRHRLSFTLWPAAVAIRAPIGCFSVYPRMPKVMPLR
jgi:hypothetical protein